MFKNVQVHLARRPDGWVRETDFQIVETLLEGPAEGEVLIKNTYLSLDPYMRGRMSDAKSYAASVALGEVMVGRTAGEVVESRHPAFRVGDQVVGSLGWQQYGLSKGNDLQKVSSPSIPLSARLGVLGMPGVTAWVGLLEIGRPQLGETVVVSAAAGAVGSVVGQLAKLKGCSVVGVVGGKAKGEYITQELGFDAYVDYKAGKLVDDLAAATPRGIDVYFENVGGEVLEAVATRLNPYARIPLCGLISQYNEKEPRGLTNLRSLLTNRVRLQGFIVGDFMEQWPQALSELEQLVLDGKLKYRETIVEGLEQAPRAFIGLLRGENIGKQLVKLA